jgi:acyl-CoA thioester hydrolase
VNRHCGHLENGKHVFELRVYYEDTDFSGLVYHANYLKYCERARSDWLRVCGVDQTAMAAAGQYFVIRRMVCEFERAARFDDILTVQSEAVAIKGARFEMVQRVLRGDEVVFTAEVTAVIVDARGKPQRISAEMAEKFHLAAKAAP